MTSKSRLRERERGANQDSSKTLLFFPFPLTTSFSLFRSPSVPSIKVWMSHGDQLTAAPNDFKVIAKTPTAPFAAIAHESKPIYGIQFHPEVTHSPRGKELFDSFVEICGCKRNWTMVSRDSPVVLSSNQFD